LDDAFSPATPDHEVLFELAVTKAWLRRVIVGLTLICHSSYRGVVEFLRDLLGLRVSLGCVHDVLQAATRRADIINRQQDLSGIRVGLHDEIFQGATPVLAGVDAASTHCHLLAAEHHRDADTWGVHLLDATQQGLNPDYTIADAGQGLRAGQRAAWGDTPCHGDVFHIQRQCEGLANTLGCSADYENAEIFSPPYLFNPNGTPGIRPSIKAAPATALLGSTVTVTVDAQNLTFEALRMSATIHTVNNEQRRIPLTATANLNGRYDLTVPSDPGVVLPGYYMLFAINAQGILSVANTIKIGC